MSPSPLCLIPLALDKFEVCCVPTEKSHHACWRDAKEEVVAELKDGSAYFIPICDNPEHRKLAEDAKKKLLKGTSIYEIRNLVTPEQVFLKPTELPDKKCKVTQWDLYKKMRQLPTMAMPQPPKTQAPVSKVHKVSTKWQWVDEIGQWCNIKGEVVSIKKLDDHELKLTLMAVCNANFKKVPPDLSWIRDIVVPTNEIILFPENALVVKASRAKDKLDDFRVEARRRGYL
jgi:hypothetical protein